MNLCNCKNNSKELTSYIKQDKNIKTRTSSDIDELSYAKVELNHNVENENKVLVMSWNAEKDKTDIPI